jgi:hypothetical protein
MFRYIYTSEEYYESEGAGVNVEQRFGGGGIEAQAQKG